MKALERRLQRLERGFQSDADIERAQAVLAAWNRVRDHPELATEADRLLAKDWQRALIVCIEADGGLEAVILESMKESSDRSRLD